tara:strand:+ start:550 stop:723 length:174 start_codon:yes stop_codon:yes gene_type:complete
MPEAAVMFKIVEPSGMLYEIRSITDEDVRFANRNFIENEQPFRVFRYEQVNLERASA